MHKSYRTQRRLAGITEVSEPCAAFTERMGVLRRQVHEQTVRVLSIDQRLAFVGLARLKQQGRSAGRKSKRFSAEHRAQLQSAFSQLVKGHRHDPVRRLKF